MQSRLIRRALVSVLVLGSLVTKTLSSRVALADDKETPPAAVTTTEPDGYGYHFKDDTMRAGGLSPTDPRIHVVRHTSRSVLLRLRTQFVQEMLKSVEEL